MKLFCVVTLLLLSNFSLAAMAPDYSNFIGVYEGTVVSGGVESPMVTTLIVTPAGQLKGSYTVNDSTGMFNGTLSNPRLYVDSNTLSFEWTDQHGEGFEVLEFSDDFNRFSGFWGNRNSNAQFALNGAKK